MRQFITKLYCFSLALILLFVACGACAKPITEVDSFIDLEYDFSSIRSLCPWPVSIDDIPDIVSLSLPLKASYWIENSLAANRGSLSYVVKSPEAVWRDVWFIRGPFDFGNPFANEDTERVFYSNLSGACGAVLKTTVSVQSERKWQEPRTEYYWAKVSISTMRPYRRRGGETVWVRVSREVPIRRKRVIPGYWYTIASAQCGAELYDTDDPDKFIAASKASGEDTGRESEKQIVERLVKKTLEDAVAAIFHST